MKLSRICFLGLLFAVCALPVAGCKKGDDAGIDAPLTKDAPPPPNVPVKKGMAPGGGVKDGGDNPTGASATP